jgi:hypothetical protein
MNIDSIINSSYQIDKTVCKDNNKKDCGFGKDSNKTKIDKPETTKQKPETSDKSSDKPSDKPSDKSSDKSSDKPSDKSSDKPSDKSSDKPSDKSSEDEKKQIKKQSIQMKIPVSNSIITNTQATIDENPDDKVNIVIKSCKNITSKQALLIVPITKFFSNRNMLNKVITILKGESISLRLIDWFVTNYCKKHNILYNINDFKGDQPNKTPDQLRSFDNFIIVHNNYKGQLKAYSKRNFDPFCRRNRIRFYYEDNKYFITTVGQLNFFKWALEYNIIDYIEKHLKLIDNDMNLRCETVKKNGTKINLNIPDSNPSNSSNPSNPSNLIDDTGLPLPIQMPIIVSTKKKKIQDGIVAVETQIKTQIKSKGGGSTRKKRKEISTAASKTLSIHNFPTTLIFD